MQMVADEHGLKMSEVFKTADGAALPGQASAADDEQRAQPAAAGGGGGPISASAEDDLEERLRKLRS